MGEKLEIEDGNVKTDYQSYSPTNLTILILNHPKIIRI